MLFKKKYIFFILIIFSLKINFGKPSISFIIENYFKGCCFFIDRPLLYYNKKKYSNRFQLSLFFINLYYFNSNYNYNFQSIEDDLSCFNELINFISCNISLNEILILKNKSNNNSFEEIIFIYLNEKNIINLIYNTISYKKLRKSIIFYKDNEFYDLFNDFENFKNIECKDYKKDTIIYKFHIIINKFFSKYLFEIKDIYKDKYVCIYTGEYIDDIFKDNYFFLQKEFFAILSNNNLNNKEKFKKILYLIKFAFICKYNNKYPYLYRNLKFNNYVENQIEKIINKNLQ